MTTAHTAATYTEDEIKGLLQKLREVGKRVTILEDQKLDLVNALQGLLRAGHGLSTSSLEWNAVHAALAKAGTA